MWVLGNRRAALLLDESGGDVKDSEVREFLEEGAEEEGARGVFGDIRSFSWDMR